MGLLQPHGRRRLGRHRDPGGMGWRRTRHHRGRRCARGGRRIGCRDERRERAAPLDLRDEPRRQARHGSDEGGVPAARRVWRAARRVRRHGTRRRHRHDAHHDECRASTAITTSCAAARCGRRRRRTARRCCCSSARHRSTSVASEPTVSPCCSRIFSGPRSRSCPSRRRAGTPSCRARCATTTCRSRSPIASGKRAMGSGISSTG